MFYVNRARVIKKLLLENKQVNVNALAEMFNVSEVTVRRDLEKLEKEGALERIHGGAVLKSKDTNFLQKEHIQPELFQISKIALKLIIDGDVIMLIDGEINKYIAKGIYKKNNVTVLTNSLEIAREISTQVNNRCIIIGGMLGYNSLSIYGSIAEKALEEYFINKLFADIDGISKNLDMTLSSPEKSSLMSKAFEISNEKIIVCSKDAFSSNAFHKVNKLNIADRIITDSLIPEDMKKLIFENGIPLHTTVNPLEGDL